MAPRTRSATSDQEQLDLYAAAPPSPLRLSLVMMVKPVWILAVTVLPVRAATACSTPSIPMVPGCCATSAWMVPSFSCLDLVGPASKPTMVTAVLFACLHPGRGALGGEQVRREDADDVGVLLQGRGHELGRRGGVVMAVLHAEVVELRVGLDRVLEALDAGVDGRDAGVGRDDEDLATLGVAPA